MAISCKPIIAVIIATLAATSCAVNKSAEKELPAPLKKTAQESSDKKTAEPPDKESPLTGGMKELFTAENEAGTKLLKEGKYKEAESHFEKSIEYGKKLGQNSENLAKFGLCRCYSMTGDLDKALKIANELLEFYENQPTPKGEILNLIGSVYEQKGKLEQSEEYFKKALASYQKAKKLPEGQIIQVENNLGLLNLRRGKFKLAASQFEKIVDKTKHSSKLTDLVYISSRINLGLCYTELSNFEEAYNQLDLAQKKAEDVYGKQHYFYGKAIYGKALLYGLEKKYEKAIIHCEEAITIFESANAKRDLISALRVDYQLRTITKSHDKAKEINQRIKTLTGSST